MGIGIGPAIGVAGSVAGIGLVAGAEGVINNQLNNAVKAAKNETEREKG